LEVQGRVDDVGRVADWHRRQRQSGRGRRRGPDQGRDRLRRIFLCQAGQAQRQLAINKAGKAVVPATPSFAAAASNANWAATPDFVVILTNPPGPEGCPITSASFGLMHRGPTDTATAGAALKFFDWAYAKGGGMAEELDYIPLPAGVVAAVR